MANDDHDLILAINKVVTTCQPLEVQFPYVKGHQDTKADCPLTLEEQYNVECDCLAKLYVKSAQTLSTTMASQAFEAAQPHLCIVGKIICQHFLPALQEHIAQMAYCNYLCKKLNWTGRWETSQLGSSPYGYLLISMKQSKMHHPLY